MSKVQYEAEHIYQGKDNTHEDHERHPEISNKQQGNKEDSNRSQTKISVQFVFYYLQNKIIHKSEMKY